jgi:hypothetical protein
MALFRCRKCGSEFESIEPADDASKDAAGSYGMTNCWNCGAVAVKVTSSRRTAAISRPLPLTEPNVVEISPLGEADHPFSPNDSPSRKSWFARFAERREAARKHALAQARIQERRCPHCHFEHPWNGEWCRHCGWCNSCGYRHVNVDGRPQIDFTSVVVESGREFRYADRHGRVQIERRVEQAGPK